jgi:LPXTG-motif cell wall-anchored protein
MNTQHKARIFAFSLFVALVLGMLAVGSVSMIPVAQAGPLGQERPTLPPGRPTIEPTPTETEAEEECVEEECEEEGGGEEEENEEIVRDDGSGGQAPTTENGAPASAPADDEAEEAGEGEEEAADEAADDAAETEEEAEEPLPAQLPATGSGGLNALALLIIAALACLVGFGLRRE